MKIYEIIILGVMTISGVVYSLASMLDISLFPYFIYIPQGLFLILFTIYSFQISEIKRKTSFFIFILLSLVSVIFSILSWKGQFLIGILKTASLLTAYIIWLIYIVDKTVKNKKNLSIWVCILFLIFLVSQLLTFVFSFFVFIAILVLTILHLRNKKELDKTNLSMTKTALIFSLFSTIIQFKTTMILSFLFM